MEQFQSSPFRIPYIFPVMISPLFSNPICRYSRCSELMPGIQITSSSPVCLRSKKRCGVEAALCVETFGLFIRDAATAPSRNATNGSMLCDMRDRSVSQRQYFIRPEMYSLAPRHVRMTPSATRCTADCRKYRPPLLRFQNRFQSDRAESETDHLQLVSRLFPSVDKPLTNPVATRYHT